VELLDVAKLAFANVAARVEARILIQTPIDHITKQDIESLVSAKVSERRTLDYKLKLHDGDSEGKREFLYDVSSFANAAGGDMVFGIGDERDANGKSTGLPALAEGLSAPNVSEAIARLESLARDGIAPRVQGTQWQVVEGFPRGPVIIMRIPKSLNGPHMVVYGGMARFYSRNTTGKYPMDVAEIRSAFTESTAIGERLRTLREESVVRIMNGATPLGLVDDPAAVLHLVPLSSLGAYNSRDVSRSAAQFQLQLSPITGNDWTGRYNFDGYMVTTTFPKSYVQVFRPGRIEAVDASLLKTSVPGYEKQIPSIAFEKSIISAARRYLDVQNHLAIPLPVFTSVTMLRVLGFKMSSRYPFLSNNYQIDRNVLHLPEVVVEDYGSDVASLLRPTFDALWQACGLEGSLNYDTDGIWRPHHS
jgi:hypothetical protein